jgi:fumarate hydratase class II
VAAPNKFAAAGSLDAIVAATAALKGLAVPLMKIANDMRWLASGPRCGLAELILPANEPGSSIMPGKVNPTQYEAMAMICIQVIGEENAVSFAGSQGNFELNAMRPLIINDFLHAARILADGCEKFRTFAERRRSWAPAIRWAVPAGTRRRSCRADGSRRSGLMRSAAR